MKLMTQLDMDMMQGKYVANERSSLKKPPARIKRHSCGTQQFYVANLQA